MTSLLQFNGTIDKRGVGLEFIKSTVVKNKVIGFDRGTLETWTTEDKDYDEKHLCTVCGQLHPRMYVAFRKPCGMFGCWVQFRYNGEVHVPDLSIPITVKEYPRDAIRMSDVESSRMWHNDYGMEKILEMEMNRVRNLMR
ncbi:MAG TPA: hypothetical protein DSN98_09195 [Thermoplasmata archaeon]|jgi:hypothetical protein|nr:MAG TPA: hypothetical protein DSN98_09195 [Thermoplasmata archaeon]